MSNCACSIRNEARRRAELRMAAAQRCHGCCAELMFTAAAHAYAAIQARMHLSPWWLGALQGGMLFLSKRALINYRTHNRQKS